MIFYDKGYTKIYYEVISSYYKEAMVDENKLKIGYWILVDDAINKYKDSSKNKTITVGPKNKGTFIKVGEMTNYVDSLVYSAYRMWNNWKTFGLPLSVGWAEHPKRIIDAIRIIDREYNSYAGGK